MKNWSLIHKVFLMSLMITLLIQGLLQSKQIPETSSFLLTSWIIQPLISLRYKETDEDESEDII